MPDPENRPITPEEPVLPGFAAHKPGTEYDTPHRAGLRSIQAWEFYNGRKPDLQAIFRFLCIEPPAGYKLLKAESIRTLNNRPGPNPRIPKRKIDSKTAESIAELLDNEDDAQFLTWTQLAAEFGIDACERTIRLVMREQKIVDAIQSKKPLVTDRIAKKRIERAKGQLESHPEPEDWMYILYSDEVHFGWSDEGKVHIKRRIGSRNNPRHIGHPREPRNKDQKRFHCWAMVGWGFKSKLYFYDSGNSNGKMTQKAYIEQILEVAVKPLIQEGRHFVLFEDNDSGHGPSKSNPVREWKKKHGLKSYFNVSNSPDLNIIENCWLIPKNYVRKYPHWNDEETKSLILEGWDSVPQDYINRLVETYPDRFEHVEDTKGQLTAW